MAKSKQIISILLVMCLCFSVVAPCVMADEAPEYATREYIISEFVQSVGRNTLEESEAVLEIFEDSDKISAEYKDDISRAIVGGILKGYEDRTIRPDEPVSRVEAMVMLSRCVSELSQDEETIEFTDVPNWAKEEITYLSKAGIVKGYGNGKMGAEDYITTEQVGILVERIDDSLRTVQPGDSFYGYVNEKKFRNVELEDSTEIDPLHGAVVTKASAWSYFDDIYNEILAEEEEILTKLVNGELEVEKGSSEQRVLDMLECIDADVAMDEDDIKYITDIRNAIVNAKTVEEFLTVVANIYKLAGINVLFDINVDSDAVTGVPYPTFSIAAAGNGGFLAYRSKTDTKEYEDVYAKLISDYLKTIGAEFTQEEISNAIKIQKLASKDIDFYAAVVSYLSFAELFGVIDEEELKAELADITARHPEIFDEVGNYIGNYFMLESKDREAADAVFNGFDVCEELADYGFTNLEKIIVPIDEISANEKDIVSEKNLAALKINALMTLNSNLDVNLSEEEKGIWNVLNMFPLMVCLTSSVEELEKSLEEEREDNSDEEAFAETTGVEFDEGLLSAVNLNQLQLLLPDDIGLLYAKYYYDDEISYDLIEMIQDIGAAYKKRFESNTWMTEKTKANAIKKLENMIAVIGYPDNYTFPEITPISEGGSLFSNTLSIKRHELSNLIRSNEDKEFIRTLMLAPPDTVNAFYMPMRNTINIFAGILNEPMYDKDASYAANLGGIGMVMAHEIGHGFDKTGAMYDENGCLVDWWEEEDYEYFTGLQEKFVEYYNQFEVVDGVVQDANITITENMADFAAMQVIMDIIGDDKEAQKECFESYARIWAKLGTVSYLTDNVFMSDVHAANVVRVNAVVSSFDQFYDIYNVQEGDPMYVAPEERLKLW